MRRRNGALVLGLACALVIWQGCSTCRPDQPAVQPTMGGGIAVGSGGVVHGGGAGLDVSNLFCRAPDADTRSQPGPGSPPIQDLPPQQPAKPTASDAR
ncbi:MAG TPA: hypothetical protein DEP35_17610 [Deltaproteobacteria bacterium]|nr:hypothetical protein [Deltaproteobacteria bacterium]